MNLENLRNEVDEINLQIIELLAKRVHLTQKIATIKKEHSLPIEDKNREKQQNQKLKDLAEKYDLSPQAIEEIFFNVVTMCKNKMRTL